MSTMIMAIDGACRRNGKPNCTAAGGVFVMHPDGSTAVISCSEQESTNQRGELSALLMALQYATCQQYEVQLITDSEYIFNAMTKQWYSRWRAYGWTTAAGDPVKNKDIWQQVCDIMENSTNEVHFYHIKGHCIPFGKVTAENALFFDSSGELLLNKVSEKFEQIKDTRQDIFAAAQQLSEKNNGFKLPEKVFKRFVVFNTVADAIATHAVEIADRER